MIFTLFLGLCMLQRLIKGCLKGNPGQGTLLRSGCDLWLTAWCDADWGGCHMSHRSLTTWFIQLGGSPVSWRTRKHMYIRSSLLNVNNVSRSSTESEYRAMADTVSELLWMRELLGALGVDCSYPIPLHCDNQSAIYLSKNLVFMRKRNMWLKIIILSAMRLFDESSNLYMFRLSFSSQIS